MASALPRSGATAIPAGPAPIAAPMPVQPAVIPAATPQTPVAPPVAQPASDDPVRALLSDRSTPVPAPASVAHAPAAHDDNGAHYKAPKPD